MVYKVNHKKLKKLIKLFFKHKKAFFTWGRIGIGKSENYNSTAVETAKELNREFIDYNRVSKEKKEEVINNPEPYFVFVDLRLSEMDSTDIKGLVSFTDAVKRYIEWKMPMFAEIMTNPKSAGFLLLDEINLSAPLVQSSAYKVVYDRIIGEYCINGNWGIFGAGNLAEDNCFTHEVSPALKDRGGEVELQIPTIEDLTEYALQKKIEGRVIGFLNFKSSNIFKVEYNDAQKDTTPRGWFRVGEMIKGVENLDDVLDIASSNISEGIAVEFVTWLKLQNKVNMREIIKNPNKIKEFDSDKKDGLGMKYFVITALADWYRDDKAKFEDIIKITEVFDEIHSPEFVSLLWRLCLSYKPEFEKEFLKRDVIKLASKYLQYLR